MSNVTFEVQRVRKGTPNQVKAGIHGTFTLAIVDEGITLLTLHDYKLCQTKAGDWYIQSPYRTYDGKNRDTGEPETKRLQYYKLFPNKEDWKKQDPVVELVRREVEKSSSPAIPPATSAPAAVPAGAGDDELF